MATKLGFFGRIKKSWKLLTFVGTVSSFIGKKIYDRNEIDCLMQEYCFEANEYGKKLMNKSTPRHVTVILNTFANNRQAGTHFNKYCSPLLNLAGIKVAIMETHKEGDAKELMTIMDNTDAVLIAGGKGTIHECLNGLLHREDYKAAAEKFPIGIIPLGSDVKGFKMLSVQSNIQQIRSMADTTMAFIKENLGYLPVVKIEGEDGKAIFCVSDMELGALRETETTLDKYWYLGPLKRKVAYLKKCWKDWPVQKEVSISFLPPCDGCSKCFEPEKKRQNSWFNFFSRPSVPSPTSVQCSSNVNENCGIWEESSDQALTNLLVLNNRDNKLSIIKHPGTMGKSDFIKEGWNRNPKSPKDYLNASEIEAKAIKLKPLKEDEEIVYYIDNELYPGKPVHINIMPKTVYTYIVNK